MKTNLVASRRLIPWTHPTIAAVDESLLAK